MGIETKYLGVVQVNKEQIFHFPSGLLGFEEEKEFALLNFPNNDFFQILQSIHNSELAFIIADPYHFYNDYVLNLDDQIQKALQIEKREDVLVMVIVTLSDPFIESTLNLKAPLIFNINQGIGKQYILQDDKYSLKAPIQSQGSHIGKRDA